MKTQCGDCLHWHKEHPASKGTGVCRANPPIQLEYKGHSVDGGPLEGGFLYFGYPSLPISFPTCGKYDPRIVVRQIFREDEEYPPAAT